MKLQILDQKETLDAFAISHDSCHYQKTSQWAAFMQKQQKCTPQYIGFFDEEKLAGTACLLKCKWLSHTYFYVPSGSCMESSDADTAAEAMQLLADYAKAQKAEFIRTDPDIIRMHHNLDGSPADDGFSNDSFVEKLKSSGWIHAGYQNGYDGSWNCRYHMNEDLTLPSDQIESKWSDSLHAILKMQDKCGIVSSSLSSSDINSMMLFEEQLIDTENIKSHGRRYYEDLFSCLSGHISMYAADINMNALIDQIESGMDADSQDSSISLPDMDSSRELAAQYGSNVRIAAAAVITYGTKSWILHAYCHQSFVFLHPLSNLYAFVLKDLKEKNVNACDLGSFSGSSDKNDPYYDQYAFMAQFNPVFEEFIGQLDYPADAKSYQSFIKQWKLLHHQPKRKAKKK